MSNNGESVGHLLDPTRAKTLETDDRSRPNPGGETVCPECGSGMTRHVEKYPAPRADDSPFRVRLVCASGSCGAWTVYDW